MESPCERLFHNSSSKNSNSEDQQIHQPPSVSDSESGISCTETEQQRHHDQFNNIGLIRVHHEDKLYEVIEKKMVSSSTSVGLSAQIESIHRISYNSSITNQAKFQCFCVYLRATKENRGGDANAKYAWFGASKDEINNSLVHGFRQSSNRGVYGSGVYLSPSDHPSESMQLSLADDDGLKHLLLCRVIMGRWEVVHGGSEQCNPSSEEFDSGVDNLASPRKYIVWSSRMNTHILPEFVISLRTSSNFQGNEKIISNRLRLPTSAWIPFSDLVNALSQHLPPPVVQLIAKHHRNRREKKITRRELIQLVRSIAGDKLLAEIIKSHRNKDQDIAKQQLKL